jgi:hypothetical protein
MRVWAQALASSAVLLAVAMRTGERRVVESLEGVGAVDPGTAKKFPDESFIRKWHFRRLLNAGVVGETMDQGQYIKIVEYVAYQHRRRMRALVAVAVIVLVGSFLFFRS